MEKSIKFYFLVAFLGLISVFSFAQSTRPTWDQVQGPDIISISQDEKDRTIHRRRLPRQPRTGRLGGDPGLRAA